LRDDDVVMHGNAEGVAIWTIACVGADFFQRLCAIASGQQQ